MPSAGNRLVHLICCSYSAEPVIMEDHVQKYAEVVNIDISIDFICLIQRFQVNHSLVSTSILKRKKKLKKKSVAGTSKFYRMYVAPNDKQLFESNVRIEIWL